MTRTAARQKAKDLNARFAAFFELYCREPGCRGLASFFPHVEPHDEFVPDIGAPSFEFRDRELTRLEALWAFRARLSRFKARTDRGKDGKKLKKGSAMAPMRRQADGEFPAQAFEGNVDYLWAVDTGQLEAALKEKLLRKSILALFAQELTFRMAYPELQARVKRKLQGAISFDINANEAYVSSFALQSPSLVAYERVNCKPPAPTTPPLRKPRGSGWRTACWARRRCPWCFPTRPKTCRAPSRSTPRAWA